MNRYKAAALHLTISILVFISLLGIIITVWYPGVLFNISGGWTGLKLVMGVDVVLGPLLTLIIFKVGKPGLKFDLSCIATAQVICMAAGLYIVYSERPLALVMAYDTFYSLSKDDFTSFEKDPGILESFPGSYPKMLYTKLPDDDISAEIEAVRSVFFENPLFLQTEKYEAIPTTGTAIFRKEEQLRSQLPDAIKEDLVGVENCIFNRFTSAHIDGYVCFDLEKMKLTRFVPS